MITGNPHPALTVKSYTDPAEAVFEARKFLKQMTQYL
jgi:hypothetical protein